jgi:hypothetical protein
MAEVYDHAFVTAEYILGTRRISKAGLFNHIDMIL